MVVPKLGAQYMLKRLADEMMAPVAAPTAATADQDVPQQATAAPVVEVPVRDGIDGTIIHDDEGQPIGRARRAPIAVYLISPGYGNIVSELEECLEDEDCRRYFVHDDEGDLTGIIFAPSPDRMPQPTEAIRADDI